MGLVYSRNSHKGHRIKKERGTVAADEIESIARGQAMSGSTG